MKFTKRLNKTGLAMTIASAGLLASSNSMASDPSHLEHNHGAGTFMVATEFMNMRMDGNISGTKNPGKLKGMKAQGGQGYMVEPTQMDMQMFMLMPMYNVTSDFSVMLMANYISNSMEMDTTATGTQSMSTSGIGDTQLSFDYKMFDQSLAVGLGVNIPTGSITEETEMTMMMDHDMGGGMVHTMAMEHSMRAPYSMQLGSGTYDFKPSLTYLGAFFTWRYGAQVSYTYRSGENSEGYTLGDSADAMLWVRKAV
ncbi:MAG: hypothetical protein OEY38_21105, partial [Gammaproteobacteria bacterium]|nr:hypothetical protein [Gammaproteobacteria bacterium]